MSVRNVHTLCVLDPMGTAESMEYLLDKLRQTRTNQENNGANL